MIKKMAILAIVLLIAGCTAPEQIEVSKNVIVLYDMNGVEQQRWTSYGSVRLVEHDGGITGVYGGWGTFNEERKWVDMDCIMAGVGQRFDIYRECNTTITVEGRKMTKWEW